MILRKGDTIQLACSFHDKDGEDIDLTGHTVRLVAYNMYDHSINLFNVSETVASGNTAYFEFEDEVTVLWAAMEYRYYVQLSLSTGETYTSKKGFLKVDRDRETDADKTVKLNDNIICTIEDDVTIPGGGEPVNTAPVITLNGGNTTLTEGDTFNEPGYTATDAEDGDITADVVVTGSVDVNTPGMYTLLYNVQDSEGLAATQRSRTVTVEAVSITSFPDPWDDSGFWDDSLTWVENEVAGIGQMTIGSTFIIA